ncbi:MAG: dihydropteroate synthase [Victivallaceae bacterium]|nr:dihydropteroate synthase [Victivallaceae bacterium]
MPDSPKIVAIVNVTGDSFSDSGDSAPETGGERAKSLLESGADIVEFGAESTRPGAEVVPVEVELVRLQTAVKAFRALCPDAPFAVDTRNHLAARFALENGARYISDISMLRHDPVMAGEFARFPEAKLVLCHSRGTPQDMCGEKFLDYGSDVVDTICRELEMAAKKSELPRERIIFDPGFGFAKSIQQQWTMLRNIKRFSALGEVFVGVSRKSFLGALIGENSPACRGAATLATELYLARCGVGYLRTHDPKAFRDAWRVEEELTK